MRIKNIFLVAFIVAVFGFNTDNEKKNDVLIKNKFQEKVFPKLEKERYNVAFLIMDGTFNTELTAPFDIFQHTIFRENIKAMNVFLVAN